MRIFPQLSRFLVRVTCPCRPALPPLKICISEISSPSYRSLSVCAHSGHDLRFPFCKFFSSRRLSPLLPFLRSAPPLPPFCFSLPVNSICPQQPPATSHSEEIPHSCGYYFSEACPQQIKKGDNYELFKSTENTGAEKSKRTRK